MIFLSEAFTRPGDDDDAREGRVRAELHVLHVEEHEAGARRSTSQQLLDWAPFYRPNAFANTPDILHEYLQRRRAAGVSRRGSCSPATLSPSYGIYSGFESFENVPVAAGLRGVPRLGEVRGEEARRSTGRCCRSIAQLNAVRRAEPALQHVDNLRWLETENDQLIALREGRRVICVVNLDPFTEREGVCVDPGRARAAAGVRGARPADGASRRSVSTAGGSSGRGTTSS